MGPAHGGSKNRKSEGCSKNASISEDQGTGNSVQGALGSWDREPGRDRGCSCFLCSPSSLPFPILQMARPGAHPPMYSVHHWVPGFLSSSQEESDCAARGFETSLKSGGWSLWGRFQLQLSAGASGERLHGPAPLSRAFVPADPPRGVRAGLALTEVTKYKR